MNRYEEILVRLIAAEIASSVEDATSATETLQYYINAANVIEEHFKARDLKLMQFLDDVPALLKRQAE